MIAPSRSSAAPSPGGPGPGRITASPSTSRRGYPEAAVSGRRRRQPRQRLLASAGPGICIKYPKFCFAGAGPGRRFKYRRNRLRRASGQYGVTRSLAGGPGRGGQCRLARPYPRLFN